MQMNADPRKEAAIRASLKDADLKKLKERLAQLGSRRCTEEDEEQMQGNEAALLGIAGCGGDEATVALECVMRELRREEVRGSAENIIGRLSQGGGGCSLTAWFDGDCEKRMGARGLSATTHASDDASVSIADGDACQAKDQAAAQPAAARKLLLPIPDVQEEAAGGRRSARTKLAGRGSGDRSPSPNQTGHRRTVSEYAILDEDDGDAIDDGLSPSRDPVMMPVGLRCQGEVGATEL